MEGCSNGGRGRASKGMGNTVNILQALYSICSSCNGDLPNNWFAHGDTRCRMCREKENEK